MNESSYLYQLLFTQKQSPQCRLISQVKGQTTDSAKSAEWNEEHLRQERDKTGRRISQQAGQKTDTSTKSEPTVNKACKISGRWELKLDNIRLPKVKIFASLPFLGLLQCFCLFLWFLNSQQSVWLDFLSESDGGAFRDIRILLKPQTMAEATLCQIFDYPWMLHGGLDFLGWDWTNPNPNPGPSN